MTSVHTSRPPVARRRGRPPKGDKAGIPHLRRERFTSREPVFVTLRVVRGVPNLRTRRLFRVVRDALAATKVERGVRVVHFSVQTNHVHLIVESQDRARLGQGFRALGIRVAKRLNHVLGRRGPVLADRFHSSVLRTPIAVKRTLTYVLNNARRHAAQRGGPRPLGWVDRCSTAPWFDGFSRPDPFTWALGLDGLARDTGPPAVPARSDLLAHAWRRCGLIDPDLTPGA